jgi:hypothetical protein
MGPLQIAATAFQVVGSLFNAGGEYAQGRHEEAVAYENSRLATQNAAQVRLAGQVAEQAKRREIRKSLGRTAAASSQAGVGGPGYGSSFDVIKQASTEGELDAMNVRYGHETEAYSSELEALQQKQIAQAARRKARGARTAGYINAASAFFSGAANYSQMQRTRIPPTQRTPSPKPYGKPRPTTRTSNRKYG